MNIITNKTLLLIVISLISNFLFSQNKITGQIIDHQNNPIEFATISLLSENNILIKTEVSDQSGKFEIQEKQGSYILEITFLGKSIFKENINLNENKDFGIIQVENSEIIEQVTIIKEKKLIERKVDRLVFNVENSIESIGADVMDVLKVVPRVRVNNDEISIAGKGGVAVMIDGRMTNLSGGDLANYLKTLRAEDIKSIEVIPNPPAKYSAEGDTGLINIVTKKQKLDNWNIPIRAVYQQATYPMGLGGGGLNLKKDRITLNSSFSYIEGSSTSWNDLYIYYPNITWNEQDNQKRNFSKRFDARLGLDYKISDKTYTGFVYRHTNNRPKSRGNTIANISNAQTNNLDSLIITKATTNRKMIYDNLNYHFVYDIDTLGKKLSFDFDFLNYETNSNRVFDLNNYYSDLTPIDNSYDAANNKGEQKVFNYSFYLDMEHPLNWIDLNYGGRLSYINTDSSFEYYDLKTGTPILDTSQSNIFEYNENTQAAYFSAEKKFNQKWSTKAGLRLENTQLKGYSSTLNQENKNNYTKLFPTVYLSFSPNNNHSFSLNYNRRIIRPNYSDLNPFKWINSPYSYSEGNPNLQPYFPNGLELEYIFKENYVSTLYFSFSKNEFGEVSILDPDTKIQQKIPFNFLSQKLFVFTQSVNIKPLEWINIYFEGDINYKDLSSNIPTTLNYLSGWGGSCGLHNSFVLNKEKTFMFNFSFSYIAKGIDELDRFSSYNKTDAYIRALFLDKKLTLILYAYDIFNSYIPTYTAYSNNIKKTFRQLSDSRLIGLSVNYNFGKQFRVNQRESKNNEEVNRTN